MARYFSPESFGKTNGASIGMKKRGFSREPVRVLMHLNGGHTKVLLERTSGLGLADGGIEWDIPTDAIPLHLRKIGSRFIVASATIIPEESDKVEDIRRAISEITIEEL
ncbi:MAG TPA: hypothetical protein VNO70_18735 [Blastocatellia bacterium]|nr:hypothetical protein [Blastocatellia bacterium]